MRKRGKGSFKDEGPSPEVNVMKDSQPIRPFKGRPVHESSHRGPRSSLLSLVRTDVVDLQGFFTCAFVVLFATNARLVLENLMKYGLLVKISPPSSIKMLREDYPILLALLLIHFPLCMSFLLEKSQMLRAIFLSPQDAMNKKFFVVLALNLASVIVVPHLVVTSHTLRNPIRVMLLLLLAVSWIFKLFSFHHVCWDLRLAKIKKENLNEICASEEEARAAKKFPESFSFASFFEYIWMPTFCFQLAFPRTPKIRWLVAIKHFTSMLSCFALMKIIVEQYVWKTLENTFQTHPLATTPIFTLLLHLLERMLKLAVPNLYVWLLMFFAVFHHYLNLLAELTRFGDRKFYSDWWNALTFGDYWNRWNLPIHNFASRHVNKPLLRRQFPRPIIVGIVFCLSALAHEYLLVVPLAIGWTGLVFFAFLLQAPLVMISNNPIFHKYPHIANALFWILFCFLGQPILLIVYYYLYSAKMGQDAWLLKEQLMSFKLFSNSVSP